MHVELLVTGEAWGGLCVFFAVLIVALAWDNRHHHHIWRDEE